MKQKLLFIIISAIMLQVTNAQNTIDNAFFDKVSYVGAFGTTDWSSGWANYNCKNTAYAAATVNVSGEITTSTTWTSANIYLLQGFVYVPNGVTLTIQAGTIIRGEKASMGSLIVECGGKIIAEGTASNPIVFTSNEAAGARAYGDWGGLVLCGKAHINTAGGEAQIEGGPRSFYGGTDDADNSGILKYVRVEFAGYPFQPNKEINGLTFGGVGSGTIIEYVQVSYANDDSYEWFGGSVNCKHLIAYRGLDDEFDSDYGFSGMLQFLVGLRDSTVADVSGSNGFESDNDATGSDNTPQTSAIFSNVSLFGPRELTSSTYNALFKRAMHIRRNSSISVYNSIFAGWPTGLCIDGSKSEGNAKTDHTLNIENTIISGSKSFFAIGTTGTTADDSIARLSAIRAWYKDASRKNDTLATNDLLNLTDPFNYNNPNFLPEGGAAVLTKSRWMTSSVSLNAAASTITTDGGTLQITATVGPDYAANKEVEWTVLNTTGKASINQSGLLTAGSTSTSNGIVKVVAVTTDGSSISDTLEITLSNQVGADVLVTSIVVSGTGNATEIDVFGGSLQMIANIEPNDASISDVSWSITEGSDFASISVAGLLTANADGNVKVRATATDGSDVYGETTIAISNQSSSISDFDTNLFAIYPNPVSEFINVESVNIDKVVICNMLGQKVLTTSINSTKVSINISNLNNGIYFITAYNNNNRVASAKVIKK
jgi:hypothetical protein